MGRLAFGLRCLILLLLAGALGVRASNAVPVGKIELSSAERDWIRQHPVVRVGFSPGYPPYSLPNAKGELVGIDLDYLDLIAQRTGLSFQAVVASDWSTVEAEFRAGRVDLLTTLVGSKQQQASMLLTEPYLTVPVVIVSRASQPYLLEASDLKGLEVGAVRGYLTQERLVYLARQSKIVFFSDTESLLQALARGEIDATVTDSIHAAYCIKSLHLTNLRLGSALEGSNKFYFGMAQSQTLLASIMNKAMAEVTNDERRVIDERWVPLDLGPSPWLLAFKISLGVGAAATVVFFLLYLHNRRLRTELDERRRILAELGEAQARLVENTRELEARIAEVEQLNHDQQSLMRDLRVSQEAAARSASQVSEVNSHLLAANLELETFCYTVSHDLRAPLRNVTGFLELLRSRTTGRIDAESERFISILGAETVRMGMLIDDLLTFSRLGAAKMRTEPVAIDAVAATVRGELAPDLEGRVVEWQIGRLPLVSGDPILLRQVVANLLGNAAKFTRRREIARIEIGATMPTRGEKMVTIFVRDNGAGFNPKYHDKLFGVFQRLHHSRDFEGTGIGLATVKRIIARHGGRVWAEGQIDQGATFYFTLPVSE